MEEKMSEVAKVVGEYLKTSGRNVAYIDYSTKIQEYLSWYRGKTSWHNYNIFNGSNYIDVERMALCMAKTVCEDLASLLLNEKVKIRPEDDTSKEFVDSVLNDNNFREQANKLMELTEALGTGAFVVNIDTDTDTTGQVYLTPKIDFIQGDMIFPLKWDNGVIKECAFVRIGGTNKKTKYTVISHYWEKGKYIIETVEIDDKGSVVKPYVISKGIEVEAKENTIRIEIDTDVPLFQVFTTCIVNNYDKTNPLGMSCFGNAIDILKTLDAIYDSWYNEFFLGKKRIFVKSDLKKVIVQDGAGVQDQIDPSDVIFYQLDWTGENEDKPPIYESSMQLRSQEHIDSIDRQLCLLSRKVGLGDNFYSFNGVTVGRTATEVISANSALFRNIKKQELPLERALKGLVRAILKVGNIIGAGSFDVWQDITIDFDDSIIEDTEKKQQNAMAEYNAGLIDQIEYFVLTRNMTREQATKFVADMKATDTMKEVNSILNGLGGGF